MFGRQRRAGGVESEGDVGRARTAGSPARRPLVAGNWKMNLTYGRAVALAQQIGDRSQKSWGSDVDVVVCPSFTSLRGVTNVVAFDRVPMETGAQDCSPHPQGAFTGQVSVDMLTDLGVTYCIVGHSERRGELGEDDALVASKARALEAAGVSPIVCVGEDLDAYEAGQTLDRVVSQVGGSLQGLTGGAGIAVAYEPVWAIGTGKVASPEHAQTVARAIREKVAALLGQGPADRVRILYGGSVKPGNVAAFMGCPDVDGVLVGGASLDADDFCSIVSNVLAAR